MNIKALAAATVMSSTMLLTPLSVSAHSKDWHKEDRQSRRCSVIDRKQNYLFENYSQDSHWQNKRLQRLINKENDRNCAPAGDIVDTLVSNGNFSTLTAAVGAAGLVDTLKGGEFTVFAPTDEAFAKLPQGTVEALLADIPTLSSILTYHVVSGSVDAATAMTLSSAPTVNGASLNLHVEDGSLYINDSRVVLYDIKTTNGIIHVIDTVLLP